MSSSNPVWNLLDEKTGVWEATYRVPMFQSRTLAVRLQSGGFLLYSPGAKLIRSAQQEILNDVPVEVLLIPNFVHHLGIEAWREHYPKARTLASPVAMPRLRKQGYSNLQPAGSIRDQLPEGVQLLEPPGTRMGEIWLEVQTAEGCMWIVCDSFFNFPRVPKKWGPRMLMKVMNSGPGLSVSRLTYWVGIENRKVYREWVLQQMERNPPRILVPNHGRILQDEHLPERIQELL
jgi:hypothetical protein